MIPYNDTNEKTKTLISVLFKNSIPQSARPILREIYSKKLRNQTAISSLPLIPEPIFFCLQSITGSL